IHRRLGARQQSGSPPGPRDALGAPEGVAYGSRSETDTTLVAWAPRLTGTAVAKAVPSPSRTVTRRLSVAPVVFVRIRVVSSRRFTNPWPEVDESSSSRSPSMKIGSVKGGIWITTVFSKPGLATMATPTRAVLRSAGAPEPGAIVRLPETRTV